MQNVVKDHKKGGITSLLTRKMTWRLISILIGADILLILLHSGGYFLRLFPPGSLIWSMFLLNSIVLLSIGIITRLYTIVAAFMPAVIIIFLLLYLNQAIDDAHYKTIRSPIGNEAVVVKYVVTTLGESIYSYDFYQLVLGGLLLKKLSSYNYMDHGTYDSAEDVLGMNEPTWKDKKHLIFHTASGDHILMLK